MGETKRGETVGSELVATVELGCRLTAEVEDAAVIPEEFLDKDSGRAVIAVVHGSYMITYGLNEGGGLSDDDVGEFCAVNGVHTAWPFWREFVTSCAHAQWPRGRPCAALYDLRAAQAGGHE